MYSGVFGYVPVRTPDGEKPIRDIKAGDIVCGGSGAEVAVYDVKSSFMSPDPRSTPYLIRPGYKGATTGVAIAPGTCIRFEGETVFHEIDVSAGDFERPTLEYPYTYYALQFENENESYYAGGLQILGGAHLRQVSLPYDEFMKLVHMKYGAEISDEFMAKLMSQVKQTEDGRVIFRMHKKVTEPMPASTVVVHDEYDADANDA